MLFKETHLKGIKSGRVTLAFRKWQKASVQAGSLLHTSVGQIKICSLMEVAETDISENDAVNAGFENKQQLLRSFHKNSTGPIFKISVAFHSEDPRIQLREQTELSEEQFNALKQKLERFDKYSTTGQWTQKVLLVIKDHPHLRAGDISKYTGFEKEWLKTNIRKLKNLGLTISHQIGYELSPFGKLFVKRLTDKKQ